jgi:DNA modification methylase
MSINLLHGDCLEQMKTLEDNSVDAIVSDPPYGISFMSKKWDYDVPSVEVWKEAMRVLKPGGHALIACGTRTQHRMVCNIEDAGFEIRDVVSWIYGSGFPKSLNVSKQIDKAAGAEREVVGQKRASIQGGGSKGAFGSYPEETKQVDITAPATDEAKQWDGWGTALKPACEFFTLCRKPLSESTVAKNVLKWGTGGINIDGCRVETNGEVPTGSGNGSKGESWNSFSGNGGNSTTQGRFPANLIHDGSQEVLDLFPETKPSRVGKPRGTKKKGLFANSEFNKVGQEHNDSGSAARFFYCPKASKKDRDLGLDNMKLVVVSLQSCENNTINSEKLATLLVDMETLHLKDTGEFGTSLKNAKEWNTSLFGGRFTEQFQQECKSTTSTETSSTIESRILNALQHSITSDCTLVANSETENGGSPAANADQCNTLTFTISEKMASALGVKSAASETLLKISVEDGKNVHSTVKPTALMAYLCRLITPTGGVVLDPYMGSGSTGKAAVREGFSFVGIELDLDYYEICKARVTAETQGELKSWL